ncbi:MAG: sigma 54-interacting transcriptional regulator [Deltaproteobacteria bacterium]|nr:sigma 54-interacting transcriptional regulator [Deltaproteobacteria bacterium]
MRKVTRTIVDEPKRARASGPADGHALRIVDSPDPDVVDRLFAVAGYRSFGRAGGDADLQVGDPRVSGRHMRLHAAAGGSFAFEDSGSRNGTFLNGDQRSAGPLQPGDVLRAGATSMVVTTVSSLPECEDERRDLIGSAPAFRRACARIWETAHANLTVLLLGETGAGKEVLARLVHHASGRRGPYVPVNCTAIPESLADAAFFGHEKGAYTGATQSRNGYFREAEGGTLFLDEVGDLPPALQPRLLRALEQREIAPVGATRAVPVDVRIVAATNADLEAAVVDGRFRADLYARLREWTVDIPPLRERREDIMRLARHFLGAPADHPGPLFEPEVVEACLLYAWPFNVRELRQVMRGLAAIRSGPPYRLAQLPAFLRAWRQRGALLTPLPRSRAGAEVPSEGRRRGRVTREELLAAMEAHGQNVSAVARHFGRDRKQIYRWLERYGVERAPDSAEPTA